MSQTSVIGRKLNNIFTFKRELIFSMRRKKKPETLENIVSKMLYSSTSESLDDLAKLAREARKQHKEFGSVDFEREECQEIIKNIDWLFGYETKVKDTFEYLLSKMEKKVGDKDASHSTIMSAIAYYCILSDILNPAEEVLWEERIKDLKQHKKIAECVEVLERHCPVAIESEGFEEARRCIRLWYSDFNW